MTNLDEVVSRAMQTWQPPRLLRLSEWADEYFYLSPENAAEPGRWTCLPYQREIMDAISDPDVTQVTLQKSARTGYTLMLSAAIGFHVHHDPTSILVVQPTVDDAKGFSKEIVGPLLRDCPVLAEIVFSDLEDRKGVKDSSSTLTHKAFPGGILSLVGANSGTGFRRVSRRVILLDECDGYPSTAGGEGDPIALAMQRGAYFWNRKVVCGSTPLVEGTSRIAEMYESGDQRRYHVPCPHCGYVDFLTFDRKKDRGHVLRWPDNEPHNAFFECRGAGCVIEHKDKVQMIERGEWRPDNPGGTHRSYHLWAALSYSPNASWGAIATEFLEAKRGGTERLRAFVNLWLGEVWREKGESPDYALLYARRESYPIGTVPDGAVVLTAGVDVQKDRLVVEVVAWSPTKESWSIDALEIHGDTAAGPVWAKLDELLARSFPGADGRTWTISMMAVDSGYATQSVYGWCREHPMTRVIATKGVSTARMLVGSASPVDVTVRGRRHPRGYKVWPVSPDIGKSELYGFLRLRIGEDGTAPAGYCHFPEHGDWYFKQITAEHLVTSTNRRTHRAKLEWCVLPNRENHMLDARILARVAAAVLGIDRMAPALKPPPSPPSTPDSPPTPPPPPRTSSWLSGGERPSLGGWLRRRR